MRNVRRLTSHRVRAGLVVLVVGIALFGLGIAACAVRVCASATALIDAASEIRTRADAEREIAKWRKRLGKESWTELDESGRGGNYYARIANLPIARFHVAAPSNVILRVTTANGELLSVVVFVNTPTASVAIQEWFKPDMQNRFYLSYIKGAVAMARVEFPASLPNAERSKGFAVKTRCLVWPGGCKDAEDVLPVIRALKLRASPDTVNKPQ